MRCLEPLSINGREIPCGHCDACLCTAKGDKWLQLVMCLHDNPGFYWQTLTYSPFSLPYAIQKGDDPYYLVSDEEHSVVHSLYENKQWKAKCPYTNRIINYNGEDVRCTPSLNFRDVQLVVKRVRKHFPQEQIKFIFFDEYGEDLGRPHYHFFCWSSEQVFLYLLDLWKSEKGFVSEKPRDYKKVVLSSFAQVAMYVSNYVITSKKGRYSVEVRRRSDGGWIDLKARPRMRSSTGLYVPNDKLISQILGNLSVDLSEYDEQDLAAMAARCHTTIRGKSYPLPRIYYRKVLYFKETSYLSARDVSLINLNRFVHDKKAISSPLYYRQIPSPLCTAYSDYKRVINDQLRDRQLSEFKAIMSQNGIGPQQAEWIYLQEESKNNQEIAKQIIHDTTVKHSRL